MKQGTFEKEIFIHATVPAVIAVISNYSQHDRIHPLIEKVERAQVSPPGVERFLITDNLQWGPFKFKIKYQADILSVTQDTVHTEAYQSPNTRVTNISTVKPSGDGVILHETITMRAPTLLFGYAFRQAQMAHEELLKHIKDFVERQP
jgi:hypothetical protein